MSLSCECEYDPEPGDVCWYAPSDFSTYSGKRRTRCVSCGTWISEGDTVVAFRRFKIPEHAVEVSIYGEDGEIERATHYQCEECGGLGRSACDRMGCQAAVQAYALLWDAINGEGAWKANPWVAAYTFTKENSNG